MPPDITPELMTNWDWMCGRIAEMPGAYPAGSRSSYQSMTFGWIVGELVRRTDTQRRPFGQFVRQEIAEPVGATDLWLGIPAAVEPRVAKLDAAAVYVAPDGNAMREARYFPAGIVLVDDVALGGLHEFRFRARHRLQRRVAVAALDRLFDNADCAAHLGATRLVDNGAAGNLARRLLGRGGVGHASNILRQ
jgi:CubicO group peptidase (beta-lactamase class C family)